MPRKKKGSTPEPEPEYEVVERHSTHECEVPSNRVRRRENISVVRCKKCGRAWRWTETWADSGSWWFDKEHSRVEEKT